jgi:hypothetical protein
MIRIAGEPFAVIAWVGTGFVVVFVRGQERSEEWMEEVVRATGAVAGGTRKDQVRRGRSDRQSSARL